MSPWALVPVMLSAHIAASANLWRTMIFSIEALHVVCISTQDPRGLELFAFGRAGQLGRRPTDPRPSAPADATTIIGRPPRALCEFQLGVTPKAEVKPCLCERLQA